MNKTVNTFAVNYYGRPYMKDVTENKLFYRNIQVLYVLLMVCAMEIFPPLNDLLQLTTLPLNNVNDISTIQLHHSNGSGGGGGVVLILRSLFAFDEIIEQLTFPGFITALMILDTILSFTFERTIRRIYSKTNTT
jgi:hypothetical protein